MFTKLPTHNPKIKYIKIINLFYLILSKKIPRSLSGDLSFNLFYSGTQVYKASVPSNDGTPQAVLPVGTSAQAPAAPAQV
jgi:hypothetical protein